MSGIALGSEAGKLAKEICDALGLKHVQRLDIHMAHDEIFTVTAKFYPEIDGMRQLPAIMKKFRLIEIENMDKEYGLLGPNDEKSSHPSNFINERDLA
ncbi:MAG TPA: hypothetical protein VMW42_07990 [Desulfatiglandales bacterium]|nr:hypothetical protein [Desulfatiglandales bacterium]